MRTKREKVSERERGERDRKREREYSYNFNQLEEKIEKLIVQERERERKGGTNK